MSDSLTVGHRDVQCPVDVSHDAVHADHAVAAEAVAGQFGVEIVQRLVETDVAAFLLEHPFDAVDGLLLAEGDVSLVIDGPALGVDDIDRQSHLVQAVDDRLQVMAVQRERRHLLRAHADIPHLLASQLRQGMCFLAVGLVDVAADGRPSDEHHVGKVLFLPVVDGLVGAVGRVLLEMVGEDPGQGVCFSRAPLDAAQCRRPRLRVGVGVVGQDEVGEEPDAAAPVCPQLCRDEAVAEPVRPIVLPAPHVLVVAQRSVGGFWGFLLTAPAVFEVLTVGRRLLVPSRAARVIRLVGPVAVIAVGRAAAVTVTAAVVDGGMPVAARVAAAAVEVAGAMAVLVVDQLVEFLL